MRTELHSFDEKLASLQEALAAWEAMQAAPLPNVLHLQSQTAAWLPLWIAQAWSSDRCSPGAFLVVVPTEQEAVTLCSEIRFFLSRRGLSRSGEPGATCFFLPEEEAAPWQDVISSSQNSLDRLRIYAALARHSRALVVGSARAFQRRTMPKNALLELTFSIKKEQEIQRDHLLSLLLRAGYVRRPVCEDIGTFSVHGGVVDYYGIIDGYPVRLEFFGDWIESIRLYDPQTQRTLRSLEEVWLAPVSEQVETIGNDRRLRILEAGEQCQQPSAQTRMLLEQMEQGDNLAQHPRYMPAYHAHTAAIADYVSNGSNWVFVQPHLIAHEIQTQWEQAGAMYQRDVDEKKLAFAPAQFYLAPDDWTAMRSGRETWVQGWSIEHAEGDSSDVHLLRVEAGGHDSLVQALHRAQQQDADHLLAPLAAHLRADLDGARQVAVIVGGITHGERLESLLRSYDIPVFFHRPGLVQLAAEQAAGHALSSSSSSLGVVDLAVVNLYVGVLQKGFTLPQDGLAVYSETEIFGEKKSTPSRDKKTTKNRAMDFSTLPVGGYVVHRLHGVGRYLGLTQLPLSGVPVDFVHLQYDGGMLYLPVWRLSELQRYTGAEGAHPKLDKLGGETWSRTQTKVAQEVEKLAEELLKIYAQRQALPGTSFQLSEGAQQRFAAFESTFPYEETPDQQRAIDDVLADLDQARPMDRLVCGDVGYGKTEVALRAAMRVALAGYQVALLAPTTVLVEQHAARFAARFEGFSVRIASLSRFRSRAEQQKTLQALADGSLDIVVGTHRLLSSDVRFQRLGLLIIDEEQRFGVAHKEQLKKFRSQLDTLTLSATPIPRTLHMAFGGMREISLISTPPQDRLSVRTLIARPSESLIREGIQNELQRGGQVFFVHNRIESIETWAQKLKSWIPAARIVVAHGQMPEDQLEQVMLAFVRGEADVLLSTTIIESGLDISRANTLFVDRADLFGLSQLYQLRGRVGRSKERAYCYLLIPPEEAMGSEAKQRLAVLQRFSDLGSGFNIASQDLEIRGAGELLGSKQSGSMAAVGFDRYLQMLQEAVAHLKQEAVAPPSVDVELTCDVPAFIPAAYVADVGQRMDFYKRLASADEETGILQCLDEIRDRYGEIPNEVRLLADLMVVKSIARKLGVSSLEISGARMALLLGSQPAISPQRLLEWLGSGKTQWKWTADKRLARMWAQPEQKQDRLTYAKTWLLELSALRG